MNEGPKNTQSGSLNPFVTLQENAEKLFEQIQSKHSSLMKCSSGCSSCCQSRFSIFAGEALLIADWFSSKSTEEQDEIRNRWKEKAGPRDCAFLRNQQCTIYPARPTICRTQGAPLKAEDQTDCCPLNFKNGSALPESPRDWIDLERLAILQSIAEQFLEHQTQLPRELSRMRNKEGRIELSDLQVFLAQEK